MVQNNIKINDAILKDIKEIAIEKNTTQNILINNYLKKAVEEEKISPDCKKLNEELDAISADMKAGNRILLDVDKLEERYQV